jgi:hypothetical protein
MSLTPGGTGDDGAGFLPGMLPLLGSFMGSFVFPGCQPVSRLVKWGSCLLLKRFVLNYTPEVIYGVSRTYTRWPTCSSAAYPACRSGGGPCTTVASAQGLDWKQSSPCGDVSIPVLGPHLRHGRRPLRSPRARLGRAFLHPPPRPLPPVPVRAPVVRNLHTRSGPGTCQGRS